MRRYVRRYESGYGSDFTFVNSLASAGECKNAKGSGML
jgi:hypothetical protein